MASIKIFMKDGTVKDYPHVGRPGGSYTKEIRYEGGMAIVKDEFYREVAYPVSEIERVEVEPQRW